MKLFETVHLSDIKIEQLRQDVLSKSKHFFKGGYGGYSTRSAYIAISIFNAFLTMLLIMVGLPIFIAISIAIKLTDKGPIFYRGIRLGWGKKPFFMYKFRTLPVGSQKTMGAILHNEMVMPLKPLAKFLRDTRLDELPQLFNILIGDMDFIGPRPIRPEIYETLCHDIPNYDRRFIVRPGLIGVSQIFTPHSSPKRIRALIDNHFLYTKRNLFRDIFLIFYTACLVIKTTFLKGGALFYRIIIKEKLLNNYHERRTLERIKQESAFATLNIGDNQQIKCRVVDMNESFIKLQANELITQETFYNVVLSKNVYKNQRIKIKTAQCSGKLYKKWQNKANDDFFFVLAYTPSTPFNYYLIDKYFLNKSIA